MAIDDAPSDAPTKPAGRPLWLNVLIFSGAAAAGLIMYFFLAPYLGMTEAPRRMATIFVVALVLWVTEAIPLFATSMLVIVMQAWWLALSDDLEVTIQYQDILTSLGSPIIFLFLGGFILARAIQKEKIDVQMASVLMRPFGSTPGGIMAGVMVITAFFSMFMSNTATTAMMIVLIQPLASRIPADEKFRRGLVLSVPFAANVGGIGTPIGTPPNAIALEALRVRGLDIDFFTWMIFSIPLLLGTLAVMWAFLLFMFPARSKQFDMTLKHEVSMSFKTITVYVTFAVTVGLWLATPWIDRFGGPNIPTAVVALVPAAVFTATKVITRKDFNNLEWDVLMLIAGGIALGTGLQLTELDAWLVDAIPSEDMSYWLIVAICCCVVVGLGTVMSHTVATTIVVPLGIAVAHGVVGNTELQILAVMIAVASSYAVGLPISTPPNAIAYGSGLVSTRDIMAIGVITSIIGTILIIATGPAVVGFFLRLML